MMRDEVLGQLMESVYLLEMVEEVLSSQEPAAITEALIRGMRITLQNVREGIVESCEWVAAVEEEASDEAPAGEVADEPAVEGFDDTVDEAVIADFIAEERRAAEVSRSPEPEVPIDPPSLKGARPLGGRTLLESILRQGPSAAEVMQRRHKVGRFGVDDNAASGRWAVESSGGDPSERRSTVPVTVSIDRSGEAGFILDSIERILE